jgi:hypothetical protein
VARIKWRKRVCLRAVINWLGEFLEGYYDLGEV